MMHNEALQSGMKKNSNVPLGSKMGLCFPMSTIAMRSASFPNTRSEAST